LIRIQMGRTSLNAKDGKVDANQNGREKRIKTGEKTLKRRETHKGDLLFSHPCILRRGAWESSEKYVGYHTRTI